MTFTDAELETTRRIFVAYINEGFDVPPYDEAYRALLAKLFGEDSDIKTQYGVMRDLIRTREK